MITNLKNSIGTWSLNLFLGVVLMPLGFLSLSVALVLLSLALYGLSLMQANRYAIAAQNYASGAIRNAQVIEAMGMLGRIHQRWMEKQHEFLSSQAIASDRAGVNSALSKLVQTLQGSLLLGLGCWLTLKGELPMGGSMMIVGSILGGRVLAPLVMIVAHWRVIVNAH